MSLVLILLLIVPFIVAATALRIWMAPWEDDQGDLNHPGYLFTEIEPRMSLYDASLAGSEAFDDVWSQPRSHDGCSYVGFTQSGAR
jgi:hypothetical protein